jgi:hypothetical protein
MLNERMNAGHLVFKNGIDFKCESHSEDWDVELDWELLRLLMSAWTRGAHALSIRSFIRHENDKEAEVAFHFHLEGHVPSTSTTKMRKRLAKELNGWFVNPSHCVLVVRAVRISNLSKAVRNKEILWSNTKLYKSPGVLENIPKGLCFAILDDNLLVRKNLERLVSAYLQSGVTSFVRGRCIAECAMFPQEVLDRNVDVAIYDQNLEFDSCGMQGIDLAKQARERGFRGCQILHSAQENLAHSIDASIFDGFVEKSASKSIVLAGITSAWHNHQRKGRFSEWI